MERMTSRRELNRTWPGGFLAAAVLGLLLAFSATPAGAQDADDPGDLGQGMEIFIGNCASCHQTDGSGSAAGRSLIDIAVEQPDRSVHIASVTDGIGNMPGYEDRLTTDEIDSVVSYVRLTFLSEEDVMEELPNTGLSSWLFLAGFALIGAGGVAVLAVDPSTRLRDPLRLANR